MDTFEIDGLKAKYEAAMQDTQNAVMNARSASYVIERNIRTRELARENIESALASLRDALTVLKAF